MTLPAFPALPRLARLAFWGALVFSFFMAILPQAPPVPGSPSDKTLHMLAFGTLGFLASLGWPQARWWGLFLALSGFGGLIEIVQSIPALGRDAQLSDLLADCAAAGLSIGLVELWRSEIAPRFVKQ